MNNISAKTAENIEEIVNRYGDMLFRICFVMLGNYADAEDALQETVLRYMQKSPAFENNEHEKAWLITTAKNKCRDMLRVRKHHRQNDTGFLQEVPYEISDSGILDALMALPEKYRLVLILYYVEDYNTNEIAKIIQKSPSAVKMRLQKGRKLLKEKYRKEYL